MINEKFLGVNGKHRAVGPPLFAVGQFMDELLEAARELHDDANVFYDDDGEPLQDFSDVDTFDLNLTRAQFLTAAAQAAEVIGRFCCLLCGDDTYEIGEMYHIHNEVWQSAVKGDGMLCIGCVEKVLGRQLTPADFTDFPINSPDSDYGDVPKSDRLRDRLGFAD